MDNKGMILTTASSVDGYRIIKQCGIVYGETVFRHGVIASLGAKVLNTIDSFKVWSREVAGSMNLIDRAREYAYSKMIDEAKRRGANAIIAIDSDNTFGENLMYLQLYGTAVVVVSDADYEKEMEKIQKEKEIEEEKRQKKEQEQLQRVYEVQQRRFAGELTREDEFLELIQNLTSMMDIWKIWQEFADLHEKYKDVNELIESGKEAERFYGSVASRTNSRKNQIKVLFGYEEGEN